MKQNECKQWLLELLLIRHPHPVPFENILIAAKQAGFAESTLRRCKRRLGGAVVSCQRGGKHWWYIRKNFLCDNDRLDKKRVDSASRELFTPASKRYVANLPFWQHER